VRWPLLRGRAAGGGLDSGQKDSVAPRFVVTRRRTGIMEAPTAGARGWRKTIGMNIKLPFEQTPNPYITPSLNFEFHFSCATCLPTCEGVVVFRGLASGRDVRDPHLAQTRKLAKKITVVVYGSEYGEVFNLMFCRYGAISPKTLSFSSCRYAEQAFDLLRRGLTENYLLAEAAAGTLSESQEMTPARI